MNKSVHKRWVTVFNKKTRNVIASIDSESNEIVLDNEVDLRESDFEPLFKLVDGRFKILSSTGNVVIK